MRRSQARRGRRGEASAAGRSNASSCASGFDARRDTCTLGDRAALCRSHSTPRSLGAAPDSRPTLRRSASSDHVFLGIVSTDIVVEPAFVEEGDPHDVSAGYWDKGRAAARRPARGGVRMICRFSCPTPPVPLRLLASEPLPEAAPLKSETRVEVKGVRQSHCLPFIGAETRPVGRNRRHHASYPIVRPFERAPIAFAHSETPLARILELFEHAVELRWRPSAPRARVAVARATRPAKTMRAVELVGSVA